MSKLRILCLHGFTSNGAVHAHQVRNLTAALSNEFEFLFPDGPHVVPLSSQMDMSSPATKAWSDYVSKNSSGIGHRAWWVARDPDPATKSSGGFEGLEQSLDFIGELIRKTGPVHAIWGFSQGGCFAGMLVSLLEDKNKANKFRKHLPEEQRTPRAGIIFSGFQARFGEYASIYNSGIDVPTMHVIGENDLAVSKDRSEALALLCRGSKVLIHPGGHDIPKLKSDQDKVIQFLRDNLSEKGRQLL